MSTKHAEVDNMQDVMDSRDVIARIDELKDEIRTCEDCNTANQDEDTICHCSLYEDEREELKKLEEFAEEASGYAADWAYGETIIRDSYFQEYAEQLADDCGMLDKDVSSKWPYTCIDWEHAAKELQYDYTAVDFDGVTYWVR